MPRLCCSQFHMDQNKLDIVATAPYQHVFCYKMPTTSLIVLYIPSITFSLFNHLMIPSTSMLECLQSLRMIVVQQLL